MSVSENSYQGIIPENSATEHPTAPWDKSSDAPEPLGNATVSADSPAEPLGNATGEPAEPTSPVPLAEPLGTATDSPAESVTDEPVVSVVGVSSAVVVLSDSLRWEVLSQVGVSSAVGLRLLGEYSFVRKLKFVDVLPIVALFSVGLSVTTLFVSSPFAPVFLVCAIVGFFMSCVNTHLAGRYSRSFESVVFDKSPNGGLGKSTVAYIIIGYLMFAVFAVLHVMTMNSWGDNIADLYKHYGYLAGSTEFIACLFIAVTFILNFLLFIYLSIRYISRSYSSDYKTFADYLNNEWTLGNAIALTVKE